MIDLAELFRIAPPPDPPPPPVDWAAARAALGVDVPDDYKALVDAYGGDGAIAGLVLYVPGHPNPYADLIRQVEVQRDVLRYLIDHDIEQPYAPEQLLPWGHDECGNSTWWLPEEGWAVVANEGRGEGWERYDSALDLLVGLLSGRLASDFLAVEGEGFQPYPYE